MKGNEKLLKTMNSLLTDELTAINQYIVHSEMCENWGYGKLAKTVRERAVTEMKHAEKLIERILFLEGMPIVSNLKEIKIGSEVPKQLANDLKAELTAVASYNAGIKLAQEVGDNVTKEMLDSILKDEDDHVDKLEEMRDQVEQMSLPLFLQTQI